MTFCRWKRGGFSYQVKESSHGQSPDGPLFILAHPAPVGLWLASAHIATTPTRQWWEQDSARGDLGRTFGKENRMPRLLGLLGWLGELVNFLIFTAC